MTTINGTEYLKTLVKFVNDNEAEIKAGSIKCTLNPSCLKYLNYVLKNIKTKNLPELTKIVSRDDLLDLDWTFELLPHLKLEPTTPKLIEKHGDLDLTMFAGLKVLEIECIKPYLISNLYTLSIQLEHVEVHDVLNSISELLDIEGPGPWRHLQSLDCSKNYIPALDKSMEHLSSIQDLDLSHNLIDRLQNIEYCYNLVSLNLSFNRISTMKQCNEFIGNLRILLLRNNKLESTEGLEKLYALEVLDLANNQIVSMLEISRLRDLPFLTSIGFFGNPVSLPDDYRIKVLSYFRDTMMLDGLETSPEEYQSIQRFVAEKPAKLVENVENSVSILDNKKPKKKNKIQRIASIQEASPKHSPKPSSTEVKEEPTGNFQEKVQQLYKEAGNSWLVILNEITQEGEKQKQLEKERKRIARQSMKQPSISFEEEEEQIIEEPAPVTIVTPAVEEVKEETKVNVPASPNLQVAERVQRSRTPSIRSPAPAPDTLQTHIHLDNAQHVTEEFFVEAQTATGDYEDRIIVISDEYLVEADVDTAVDVLKLAMKHLVRLEDVTKQSERPIVQLEFRVSLVNKTQHTMCVYKMEDQSSRDEIVKLLTPILLKNKKERTIKCMACGTTIDNPNFTVIENCTKCKSVYIVEVGDSSKKEIQETTQSTTAEEKKEIVSAQDDEYDISKDMNMQIELRLNFFKDGGQEKFVALLHTNFLVFDKAIDEERECYVLLTNMNFYILNQQRKATDKDRGLGLVAYYKLKELKKVVIGLFYQSFRIEVNETTAYVFVTRNHHKTHKFLEQIHSIVKDVADIFAPIDFMHCTRDYVKNMSLQLFANMQIQMYVMLFQRQKVSTYKGYTPTDLPSPIIPRSFIITNDQIILCHEEYGRWPASSLVSSKGLPSPQFQPRFTHKITDIISIELYSQFEAGFSIYFEEESSKDQQKWELICFAKQERQRCVKLLEKLWKNAFKINLMISTTK